MFGVDTFNYGHILTFATNGNLSWFSGNKIKIAKGCILDEGFALQNQITLGNENTKELIVDITAEKMVLFANDLPGGSSLLQSMYIPSNRYKITIESTNGASALISQKNINCFMEDITEEGNSLTFESNDSIKSITIEDSKWVGCRNQNRTENENGTCGDCLDGYTLDDEGDCISCASVNQKDGLGGACGDCKDGYIVDEDDESDSYGNCIEESPADNTILYAGGGLIALAVVATLLKK